jgi:hypothetical protein
LASDEKEDVFVRTYTDSLQEVPTEELLSADGEMLFSLDQQPLVSQSSNL